MAEPYDLMQTMSGDTAAGRQQELGIQSLLDKLGNDRFRVRRYANEQLENMPAATTVPYLNMPDDQWATMGPEREARINDILKRLVGGPRLGEQQMLQAEVDALAPWGAKAQYAARDAAASKAMREDLGEQWINDRNAERLERGGDLLPAMSWDDMWRDRDRRGPLDDKRRWAVDAEIDRLLLVPGTHSSYREGINDFKDKLNKKYSLFGKRPEQTRGEPYRYRQWQPDPATAHHNKLRGFGAAQEIPRPPSYKDGRKAKWDQLRPADKERFREKHLKEFNDPLRTKRFLEHLDGSK
jgi:hypothetical protein